MDEKTQQPMAEFAEGAAAAIGDEPATREQLEKKPRVRRTKEAAAKDAEAAEPAVRPDGSPDVGYPVPTPPVSG